ncbi:cucumisin-like [Cynara cardunculus var. scolymus]|uniref:cucumisin-like n=1 Tax=Cynara cardunculus var. scolymus TaxID=59895 RepID=UPI000D62AFBE|nr:cucumisin-like [Cynara cardunculus var. scolymus]
MASTLWLILLLTLTCPLAAEPIDLKTYIVYMGDLPKSDLSVASLHRNILEDVVGSRASKSLLRSYQRSFNGFVAKLSEDQKNKMARMEGVVSVFQSQTRKLHTTRSWDFMGFPQDVKRAPLESHVIVGMLDTGVWPESDSFKDDGFGPPPPKWKGSCDSINFTCNNKLIGAKYYKTEESAVGDEELSARDTDGHGTHTASTVAGRAVNNANLLGLANGTARGGVPSARIAVYKICWETCSDADILAAFDDAIADGVDIISISVGSSNPFDYFEDTIAIGAFHSMKNGILTSNSAGNDGPSPGSITNFSPWSLSVAASSIDRKFLTQIVLGNNITYEGPTINTFEGAIHPIVYGGSVPNTKKGFTSDESRYCEEDSLDPTSVQNKIVVCEDFDGPTNALESGASGVVVEGDFGYLDSAFAYPLPTTYLSSKDGSAVLGYINSTTTPSATILKSYEPVDKAAPTVVSFSSRGPNPITPDLLKPDLTAPGVDILAAWSMATTVTGEAGDTRVVPYNIISGTSMSCPHATGAAAYVKSFHPTWSPAAIKSALMTTAAPMSPTKNLEAEFAYGSGHIDPLKGVDPGLVYDAGESDFVSFLCGQGYNATTLKMVTGDSSSCSAANNATVWDLNYPSFGLSAQQPGNIVRTFNRTVTNVGAPDSTYHANVVAPSGLVVKVRPRSLAFKRVGEKQSFVVMVDARIGCKMVSGSLVWSDGVHNVTSPIVAFRI